MSLIYDFCTLIAMKSHLPKLICKIYLKYYFLCYIFFNLIKHQILRKLLYILKIFPCVADRRLYGFCKANYLMCFPSYMLTYTYTKTQLFLYSCRFYVKLEMREHMYL